MNLWFIVAVFTAILRATKTESMGFRITWCVVAMCLVLALVTGIFALSTADQVLLIPLLIALASTLALIGYLGYRCSGLSRL